MRPVLVLAIIILFIISAYYDLNNGTIPDNHYESNNTTENTEEKRMSILKIPAARITWKSLWNQAILFMA